MHPDDIRLVQASFGQIEPIAEKAASLFYHRLFELDPSLRALFTTDMVAQGRALMTMLRVAVAGLDHLDELVPTVRELGQRHVGYGVKPTTTPQWARHCSTPLRSV